jgi:branched-chain amino acid transport system substrate-binding protein
MLAALGTAGASVPILSACGQSTGSTARTDLPPVKIGLMYAQTGVLKDDGVEIGNGFQLYMKLAGNRLGGHPATIVVADEGSTADSGKAAFDKLLKQDNVLAVVGVLQAAVLSAVRNEVESAQVPLIGTNGSPSTVNGAKYIWRTSWGSTDPGVSLGEYVATHTNGPVALMAMDILAAHDYMGGFLSTFKPAGGQVHGDPVYTRFAPTPDTNFAPLLSAIRDSDAKAIFCFYAAGVAVPFIKQYKALGLTQKIYAPGFLTEGVTLNNEGPDAAGVYTAMNYAPDLDNAANRAFASEYQKAYNKAPSTFAMAAYDAANVLDKAIGLIGSEVTSQALNDAIGKVGQINSPRGPWEFNNVHTPLQIWYLRQVRLDGPVLTNVVISELTSL